MTEKLTKCSALHLASVTSMQQSIACSSYFNLKFGCKDVSGLEKRCVLTCHLTCPGIATQKTCDIVSVFTDPYDRDLLQSGSWAVCERPRITSLRKAALVALRRTILSSSESRKIHDELEAVRGGKRKAHRVAAAGSCRCTKRQGPAQQQRNLELKDIFGWCLTQLSLSCYFELAR